MTFPKKERSLVRKTRKKLPVSPAHLRGRVLRLRCLMCGGAPMFRRWLRMEESCGACGYVYAREGGYWLGAMYVNYGVTVALAVAAHLVMADGYGASTGLQMAILLPAAAAFTVVFFPYSRALWLALDLICDPPDTPGEG